MTVSATVYVTTGLGTITAAASQTLDPTEILLWIAASLTALGVIWKTIGPIYRETRDFLRSWNGQAAAPGIEARPGLPETVSYLGTQLHEIKGRDAQLAVALEELARWSKENGAKMDRLDERMIAIDTRVTDHRRRNEDQAKILREELEERAKALEASLIERNEIVDQRLNTISDDLARAETMRAALSELGIHLERPPH